MLDTSVEKSDVVIERMGGLDFYLDPAVVDVKDAERVRSILVRALSALDKRLSRPTPQVQT
jgi:adenylate cyclase